MPDDIRDDLDYLLEDAFSEYGWCDECGERYDNAVSDEWVMAAKRLAEWVKENCK